MGNFRNDFSSASTVSSNRVRGDNPDFQDKRKLELKARVLYRWILLPVG
jgi:hypothetical protein